MQTSHIEVSASRHRNMRTPIAIENPSGMVPDSSSRVQEEPSGRAELTQGPRSLPSHGAQLLPCHRARELSGHILQGGWGGRNTGSEQRCPGPAEGQRCRKGCMAPGLGEATATPCGCSYGHDTARWSSQRHGSQAGGVPELDQTQLVTNKHNRLENGVSVFFFFLSTTPFPKSLNFATFKIFHTTELNSGQQALFIKNNPEQNTLRTTATECTSSH